MNSVKLRVFTLILAVMMLVALFAGCNKDKGTTDATTSTSAEISESEGTTATTEAAIDISQEVDIVMYLVGDGPAGYEDVYAKVTEKVKENTNANLETKFLGWGEFDAKYPLILAAGEGVDLIYSAAWCYFVSQAQKGAFADVKDLLPVYAPKIFAKLPQQALEQATVDGKLLMIPALGPDVDQMGFAVRKDLKEKYNIGEINTIEDFGKYLEAVKNGEEGLIPFNAGETDASLLSAALCNENDWSYAVFQGGVFNSINDDEDIFSWRETPEFAEFVTRNYEWAQKGFWSQSALANTNTAREAYIVGQSASFIGNIAEAQDAYFRVMESNPEWEPEWHIVAPDTAFEGTSYRNNGMSVAASSENPERALMVLEQLYTNEEVFDLTYYGIKGVNYDLDANGFIIKVEGNELFSGESTSSWGWRNPEFQKYPSGMIPGYAEKNTMMTSKAVTNPYAALVFVTDNVANELAALSDVQSQYAVPLIFGFSEPDSGLATLKEKLKAAGIDSVLEEAKTQAAEFKANLK